jgi:threonine dehydratase
MREPRPTTLIESVRLSERFGADVVLANEAFQWTGSFKYRAASNVVRSVPNPAIVTASSGNFGQAIAYACKLAAKRCTVVMPSNSARVKVDAVRSYGATVDLIDTTVVRREARVAALAAADPEAYVASAYDDPLVIEGNASLGRELAAVNAAAIAPRDMAEGTAPPHPANPSRRPPRRFDAILVPVGGGGLSAGLVSGLRTVGDATAVWGVEPAMANDFVQSLRAGQVIAHEREPQTIADGVRTRSVGVHNWAVLQSGLAGALEVSEDAIRESMRLCFQLANVKAEPTGAVALAALLSDPSRFRGQRVCCIVTGGNVDPDVFWGIVGKQN